MKATREEMKAEAVKRMKALKLLQNVIDEFVNEDMIDESEGNQGALYWLDDGEDELVKEFEDQSGSLVYHVIHHYFDASDYDDGKVEFYNLLFVGEEKDEWEDDWEDIRDGRVMAYVRNVTYDFADMGGIQVKPCNGGLVRVM